MDDELSYHFNSLIVQAIPVDGHIKFFASEHAELISTDEQDNIGEEVEIVGSLAEWVSFVIGRYGKEFTLCSAEEKESVINEFLTWQTFKLLDRIEAVISEPQVVIDKESLQIDGRGMYWGKDDSQKELIQIYFWDYKYTEAIMIRQGYRPTNIVQSDFGRDRNNGDAIGFVRPDSGTNNQTAD